MNKIKLSPLDHRYSVTDGLNIVNNESKEFIPLVDGDCDSPITLTRQNLWMLLTTAYELGMKEDSTNGTTNLEIDRP